MPKILMLQGLPASGKSTYAKEIVTTGNYVRVNRDILRTLLHNDKFTGKNESVTVGAEKAIAGIALADGKSVVVDDCNINPKNRDMWSQFAKDFGATFETKGFWTPIDECVRRDKEREASVGQFVIKNMALQYNLEGAPYAEIVLCDVDGTIADIKHRLHHVHKMPKDWPSFFEALEDDSPRESTLQMLRDYKAAGKVIIFVSARPERYRERTWAWMEKHGFGDLGWTIIMRSDRDTRDDTEVKADMYEKYFKNKQITTVIDDRPRVIRMWMERGIDVIDVGEGVEF